MSGNILCDRPAGFLRRCRRLLKAGLPAIVVCAGSSDAGTIVQPHCPDEICKSAIIRPVSLFGEDERRTEAEYARDHKLSLKQVQNRFAASGAIVCKGFGERRSRRSVLYASGQLTARRNLITTTAHTIIDANAKLMGRLENCVFETRIDGRKVSSPLTSDYIAGFKDNRDSHFAGFDWAVIRLRNELPVEPYGIGDDLQPLFGWLDVANVIKVANFNFDNWGKSRTRTKSIADCAIKPESVAWSTGVRGLRTDCDIAPGNSGGAVLSEVSGKLNLVGIMVGTTATSFKTRKQFDLLNDYNIGALVEGEFLQAIRDMSSMMNVKEVQSGLGRLGFDPGPVDGAAGKRTRTAIRAFQKDSGLEETGAISLNLSLALGRALSDQAAGTGADKAFEAGSDAFIGDLYQWRSANLIRSTVSRPDWLSGDPVSNDIAGPQSAWASTRLRGCRNVLACLDAYGAPGQALRAAYALEKSGLVGTYVNSFTEYGAVDLVSVAYPYNTGGLVEYALVNGQPDAVAMRDGDVLRIRIADSTYGELRRQHPRAAVQLAPRFEEHRLLPGGGQRFVFAYPVTTGCQACDPLGQVLVAHDFKPDGTFTGLRSLAYAEADEELRRQVRRPYNPDELISDIALVQRRLNGLGYEAGPVDGVMGQKTKTAISEFQADHSLPVTAEITREAARLLASDGARRLVRRFETLVLENGAGVDSFGLGLLSRFQQFPDNTQVRLAALVNNIAGQYHRAGKYDEALAHLRRAEAVAILVQPAHPQLYESILLNTAEIHLAMGEPDRADQALNRAAELLRSRIPDFALPDPAVGTPSDRGRAAAGLAALREYLTGSAADGEAGTIRVKPMPVPDGNGAHIFTFQSAEVADKERS